MWNSSSTSRGSAYSKKRGSSTNYHHRPTINEESAEKLFAEIADEDDPTVAGMEGISKLCEKLEIDPLEDIRIMVLLWKMGSQEKPAQISKEEWMAGCRKLQVDSLDKLKALLPSLDTGFLDRTEFRDFYKVRHHTAQIGFPWTPESWPLCRSPFWKFCFRFNLHSTHRTLDKETFVALLNMILKGRIAEDRLETFCTFVEQQNSYTRITLDQWTSFLDFCYECEDLSTYDESNSAWPVLIDEYVEYMEEQQKKK